MVELRRAIQIDVNGWQLAWLGIIVQKARHFGEELRQRVSGYVFASRARQVGVEDPAESVQVAVVVQEKGGEKVVLFGVLGYWPSYFSLF